MNNVIDNAAASRFELTVHRQTAIAAYTRSGDAVVFTHTSVPPELAGQGIGSRLIAGALAQVRAAGLKVVPACSFVAAYVQRHPAATNLA